MSTPSKAEIEDVIYRGLVGKCVDDVKDCFERATRRVASECVDETDKTLYLRLADSVAAIPNLGV